MKPDWTEDQPIYRQLKDKLVRGILDGSFEEGAPLPSVRSIAVDLQINPITASKAYQELVADNLVEKRRGLGMYVVEGAREMLLEAERRHFIEHEWPRIVERINNLGLDIEELAKESAKNGGETE